MRPCRFHQPPCRPLDRSDPDDVGRAQTRLYSAAALPPQTTTEEGPDRQLPFRQGGLLPAVAALEPAEAATHWEHPDLWSWRRLLEQAGPDSTFIAFYLTDLDDPATDHHDTAFRSLLLTPEQNSSASEYVEPSSERS